MWGRDITIWYNYLLYRFYTSTEKPVSMRSFEFFRSQNILRMPPSMLGTQTAVVFLGWENHRVGGLAGKTLSRRLQLVAFLLSECMIWWGFPFISFEEMECEKGFAEFLVLRLSSWRKHIQWFHKFIQIEHVDKFEKNSPTLSDLKCLLFHVFTHSDVY